ncbi:MAG: hypothetical protein J6S69_09605, partial [Proteobacteria bacterium]|nr:hypothetical protein [Pseudomonadota bacterium]
NIFPVSAITYFVAPDANGINNLMRCTNDPFALKTMDVLIQENRCETLIPNIQYFEAFPLQLSITTHGSNGKIDASQSFSNALTEDGGALTQPIGEKNPGELWKNLKISTLRGVYFRLGAATRNPVTSGIATNGGGIYPAFVQINDRWHPYEHIRGAAPFRISFPSEVKSSSTLVVAQ